MDRARNASRTTMSLPPEDDDCESSLPLLLGYLNDVVWMATPDGSRVLYVSDACQRVYGRSADELRRDPTLRFKVVHPDDAEIAAGSLQSLKEHGSSAVEYRIICPDGTVRWISDHKNMVCDDDGDALFVGGIVRDITQHGRARQFIEVQKQLMESAAAQCDLHSNLGALCRAVDELVSHASSSVWLYDENGRELRLAAAPGFPETFWTAQDRIVPVDKAVACGAAARTGQPIFVTDTKNDERWAKLQHLVRDFKIMACWSMPIYSAEKRVLGTFDLVSYVERSPSPSDRQLLEMASHSASVACQCQADRAALLRVKEEALRTARLKTRFLADVSHELRTPMTSILGFAELLLEDPAVRALPAARLEDLRTIQRNGRHLLGLVNNLLDVSKIESGKLQIERVPCSPLELIAETVASLRRAAAEKNLSLQFDYEPPFPEQILSDPTRIRQILYNLIGNAIKFTEQGGVRVRLACQIEEEIAGLRFEVIDTGIGLTAEQRGQIFQPFAQADSSTTRRFGGTGLGLTVCQRLAELLDGKISVESTPRQGSTFTLLLKAPVQNLASPSPDPPLERPDARVADSPAADGPSSSLSGHFLVVDDSPDNLRLVEVILTRAGADVVTATNGTDAYETATQAADRETAFTAILMDMQMPNMDGYTATRQLRAGGYAGPIIALTARCMAGDRERCLQAGCDFFVSKPIDQAELVQLLAGLC